MTDQLLDRQVRTTPVPLGKQHLHYIGTGHYRSNGAWAARTHKGILCGTARCVPVNIRRAG